MQKFLNKLSILGVVVALVTALLVINVFINMNDILDVKARSFVTLKRGATIKTLADDLHQKGYLQHTEYLLIWARIEGISNQLKAGEYSLQPGDTLSDLLNNMVAGKVEQYKMTLIEGWSFIEILNAIHQNPHVVQTLSNPSPNEVMATLGFANQHPEGRFYPDTYYIQKNTTDIDVLKRAYQTMQRVLDEEWQGREKNLPFKNTYEALILASIVEKESGVDEERAKIAGVFLNRLAKHMRLQTDPTVIYGMGSAYKGDIRFRDLRKDTPYNTYTRKGLPPTPIASPGKAAIHAVLHPEKTDALYFVAYGDGSGRHYFSNNLQAHEKAVNQYQRKH